MSQKITYQYRNGGGYWSRKCQLATVAGGASHNLQMKDCLKLSKSLCNGRPNITPKARAIDENGQVLDYME